MNRNILLFLLFLVFSATGVAAEQSVPVDRIELDPDRLRSIKKLGRAYCPKVQVEELVVKDLPRCHDVMGDRECRMFRLLNVFRYYCGRKLLLASRAATLVARNHSKKMARTGDFEHSRRGGRLGQMAGFGESFRSTGENIAMQWTGYGTLRALRRLIHSSGHRANILSRSYSHVGIGKAVKRHRYWTQIFCIQ